MTALTTCGVWTNFGTSTICKKGEKTISRINKIKHAGWCAGVCVSCQHNSVLYALKFGWARECGYNASGFNSKKLHFNCLGQSEINSSPFVCLRVGALKNIIMHNSQTIYLNLTSATSWAHNRIKFRNSNYFPFIFDSELEKGKFRRKERHWTTLHPNSFDFLSIERIKRKIQINTHSIHNHM